MPIYDTTTTGAGKLPFPIWRKIMGDTSSIFDLLALVDSLPKGRQILTHGAQPNLAVVTALRKHFPEGDLYDYEGHVIGAFGVSFPKWQAILKSAPTLWAFFRLFNFIKEHGGAAQGQKILTYENKKRAIIIAVLKNHVNHDANSPVRGSPFGVPFDKWQLVMKDSPRISGIFRLFLFLDQEGGEVRGLGRKILAHNNKEEEVVEVLLHKQIRSEGIFKVVRVITGVPGAIKGPFNRGAFTTAMNYLMGLLDVDGDQMDMDNLLPKVKLGGAYTHVCMAELINEFAKSLHQTCLLQLENEAVGIDVMAKFTEFFTESELQRIAVAVYLTNAYLQGFSGQSGTATEAKNLDNLANEFFGKLSPWAKEQIATILALVSEKIRKHVLAIAKKIKPGPVAMLCVDNMLHGYDLRDDPIMKQCLKMKTESLKRSGLHQENKKWQQQQDNKMRVRGIAFHPFSVINKILSTKSPTKQLAMFEELAAQPAPVAILFEQLAQAGECFPPLRKTQVAAPLNARLPHPAVREATMKRNIHLREIRNDVVPTIREPRLDIIFATLSEPQWATFTRADFCWDPDRGPRVNWEVGNALAVAPYWVAQERTEKFRRMGYVFWDKDRNADDWLAPVPALVIPGAASGSVGAVGTGEQEGPATRGNNRARNVIDLSSDNEAGIFVPRNRAAKRARRG